MVHVESGIATLPCIISVAFVVPARCMTIGSGGAVQRIEVGWWRGWVGLECGVAGREGLRWKIGVGVGV